MLKVFLKLRYMQWTQTRSVRYLPQGMATCSQRMLSRMSTRIFHVRFRLSEMSSLLPHLQRSVYFFISYVVFKFSRVISIKHIFLHKISNLYEMLYMNNSIGKKKKKLRVKLSFFSNVKYQIIHFVYAFFFIVFFFKSDGCHIIV